MFKVTFVSYLYDIMGYLIVNSLIDSYTGALQTPGAVSIGSGLNAAGLPQQPKSPAVSSPTSSNPQSPQLSPTIRSGSSSKSRTYVLICVYTLCVAYSSIPTYFPAE